MRLSLRLEQILERVDSSTECILDIGTDHGLVPIEALKRGKTRRVIAVDKSRDSLKKAEDSARKAGFINDFEFVVSDGFQNLTLEKRIDVTIISGIGEKEIIKILDNLKTKDISKKYIIVPSCGSENLRSFLAFKGFQITEDRLLFDNKKVYSVIVCEFTGRGYTLDNIYFGQDDLKERSEEFLSYIKKTKERLLPIKSKLNKFDLKKLAFCEKILSE